MTWAQLPLLRLSLPFIAGIVSCFYLKAKPGVELTLLLISAAILGSLVTISLKIRRKYLLIVSGIVPLVSCFLSGFTLMSVSLPGEGAASLIVPGYYYARVSDDGQEKARSLKYKVHVISNGAHQNINSDLLIYVPKDIMLQRGDEIIIKNSDTLRKKIPNPGEFDYQAYLGKQNIIGTIFIRNKEEIRKISSSDGPVQFINRWRRNVIERIRSASVQPDTKALLMSLVMGAADDLDPGLRNSFSASGTMHVLSVSGMHVALLYMVFIKLFSITGINKRLSFLIIIFLVWIYAGLTGFSPSVLRAAVICSFVVLGEMTSRLSNSMNLLAGSCMLLLSFDPFLVFNPGFQLSYTAVAGIICFQRKLGEIAGEVKGVVKQIVDAVAVTVSAQIGTAGISLFYFGQFPVYFLFANLVIVPVSSILLYFGIIYILILMFTQPPEFLNWLCDLLFRIFTVTVNYFGQLPGAIMNVRIDMITIVLVYAFLVTVYCYGKERWKTILIFAGFTYLVSLGGILNASKVDRKKQLVIYDKKGDMIGVNMLNESFQVQTDSTEMKINQYFLFCRNVFIMDDKRILVPDTDAAFRSGDVIYITKSCKIPVKKIFSEFNFKTMVIGNGVPGRRHELLRKMCIERHKLFWSLKEKGAMVIEG